MQLRFGTNLTSEQYISQQAWQQATLERCPLHPEGSCGVRGHGSYGRKEPEGLRIARFYCRRGQTTISSMLKVLSGTSVDVPTWKPDLSKKAVELHAGVDQVVYPTHEVRSMVKAVEHGNEQGSQLTSLKPREIHVGGPRVFSHAEKEVPGKLADTLNVGSEPGEFAGSPTSIEKCVADFLDTHRDTGAGLRTLRKDPVLVHSDGVGSQRTGGNLTDPDRPAFGERHRRGKAIPHRRIQPIVQLVPEVPDQLRIIDSGHFPVVGDSEDEEAAQGVGERSDDLPLLLWPALEVGLEVIPVVLGNAGSGNLVDEIQRPLFKGLRP
jgi:hypothetical protein